MNDSLIKNPAFFPSVSAEIFFEAEAHEDVSITSETLDSDLDAELDALLSTAA